MGMGHAMRQKGPPPFQVVGAFEILHLGEIFARVETPLKDFRPSAPAVATHPSRGVPTGVALNETVLRHEKPSVSIGIARYVVHFVAIAGGSWAADRGNVQR